MAYYNLYRLVHRRFFTIKTLVSVVFLFKNVFTLQKCILKKIPPGHAYFVGVSLSVWVVNPFLSCQHAWDNLGGVPKLKWALLSLVVC